MKYLIFSIALVVVNISYAKTISLKEFSDKKLGEIHIVSNENSTHYHSPLVLKLVNKTSEQFEVEVPNGFVFEPLNEDYQKFMVTENVILKAAPSKEITSPIKAMCINHFKSAPTKDLQYVISNYSPPSKALEIAEFTNLNKFFEPSAQFLLWDILAAPKEYENVSFKIENNDIWAMIRDENNQLIPFYNQTNTIEEASTFVECSGSFNMNLTSPKNIHIAMFDINNILVKELYKNASTPKGATTLSYAFNSEEFEDDIYYIKVVMNGNVIMQRDVDLSYN